MIAASNKKVRWAIFDLDGTLSDFSHRLPLALAKDWDRFHAAGASDPVHLAEVEILRAWYYFHAGNVAIFTCRTEPYRTLTKVWMKERHIPHDMLLMRAASDRRPSTEVKMDMFNEFMKDRERDTVAFVMEDRDKCVAMWRALGLTCFQPRPGAY